jgi:hypothetical protein
MGELPKKENKKTILKIQNGYFDITQFVEEIIVLISKREIFRVYKY